MPSMPRRLAPCIRRARALSGLLATIMLAGCAGDLNPVRDVFVATGVGEAPREAPQFIEESRPGDLGYVPIGRAPPERETPVKTREEREEMEKELREIADRNEERASETRRLILLPDPEPVIVPPVPGLAPAPEPARTQ